MAGKRGEEFGDVTTGSGNVEELNEVLISLKVVDSPKSVLPSLNKFYLFPELPTEIRLRVWKLALPGPRTVEFHLSSGGFVQRKSEVSQTSTGYRRFSAMLSCHEARLVTLERFRPVHDHQHRISFFYSPEKDIVCFTGNWLPSVVRVHAQLPNLFNATRQIALTKDNLTSNSGSILSPDETIRCCAKNIFSCISFFSNLRQVVVVHEIWDGSFAISVTQEKLKALLSPGGAAYHMVGRYLGMKSQEHVDGLPAIQHMTSVELETFYE